MIYFFDTLTATDMCDGLGEIVNLAKNLINLLKWAIPIGLVVFGMLDLGKAVIASKEDEMKKAQGILIKRCIYAVAVFLVVTIVTFVIGLVGSDEWKTCWDNPTLKGTATETTEGGVGE